MDLGPEILTGVWRIIVSLLAPVVGFLFWNFKKQITNQARLEKRIVNLERASAVKQVMIKNMEEDLKEIKSGIAQLIERSYRNGKV